MATILLQAAGTFVGGLLGPVGSAIGSAVGAMAGYMIDGSLLGGARRIEGPRLTTVRPFAAEEGAPLARVYGTMRVTGDMIWATRFEETQSTERQGGKGNRGQKVTTYTYFCNAAFVLCEGEIAGVRRIWADGREIDLEEVTVRVYRGTETQEADPLIGARQGSGNAPAYRGVAYVVFDRFPLSSYGNRVPQFQFEVMRPVARLNREIRSVALLPGSTEFGLSPRPATRESGRGTTVQINRHVLHGPSDLSASLDELQALCPNLEEVAIVVTWFGDDLRAGTCRVLPKVAHTATGGYSEEWGVSGLTRETAPVVSRVGGAAAYGGSPSDLSVFECIVEIRRRGLRVALYPFIMMDVAPGNALPDPYGGTGQPAYPWRGRITCHPAPGEPDSADKTAAARAQVDAFYGSDADWGYRRLIRHYAYLAATAGGVDTFLLGSEMRSLTMLRDGDGVFPFVEKLCELAAEVRAILGSGPAITYGADWSEYFGHQPADGSGDAFFHLDPLWAHDAITAVGIDNYMPLSDWRDADYAGGNADGFSEPYDSAGLRGQVAAGEGFDWYYASPAARASGVRSPISDGAYAKPWVYRYKDIRSWWDNQHFNRIGGVEVEAPTAWQPRSKPVWFTELGCPAVDKGPNQPNVFPDAKSSENALPHFSSGGRSDVAQARYIQAQIDYWNPAGPFHQAGSNPVSPIYGGPMVDPSRICMWAWDARPFPAFPAREDEWKDGGNWQCGHWLNGRMSGVPVSELIAAILADHGLSAVDKGGIGGSVTGYLVENPTTARAALEPVADVHGVAFLDHAGVLAFRDEGGYGPGPFLLEELTVEDGSAILDRTRLPDHELPRSGELAFIDPFLDYQAGMARVAHPGMRDGTDQTLVFPGGMESGAASAHLSDWIRRKRAARDGIAFGLHASAVDVTPGSLVSLPDAQGGGEFLVTQVDLGLVRRVAAHRIFRAGPTPWRGGSRRASVASRPVIAGAPHALLLDLPAVSANAAPEDSFRIAAFASPWRAQAVYQSPEAGGFLHVADLGVPSTIGELVHPVEASPSGRIDRARPVTVALYHGELSSVTATRLLNGANMAAMRSGNGAWEVFQFRLAEEIASSTWRLDELLRGQFGTEDAALAGASSGAAFVLLDETVVKAGRPPEYAGMPLNWRVGPAGQDLGSPNYVAMTEAGGLRARLPLAPVHLRLKRLLDGDAELSWIRRGRVGADNWLADEIPLGEEYERYRVQIAASGGAVRRTIEVAGQRWLYKAAQIAADFPVLPAMVEVTVSQIGAFTGAGLPGRRSFALAT